MDVTQTSKGKPYCLVAKSYCAAAKVLVNQKSVLYGTAMAVADNPLSRRETRGQDRRDAIIAIAADLFLSHGYAGTTMSGIAAAVGGSKATLWGHFESKESLFEAVMDRITATFQAQLAEILAPRGDLRVTLRGFCQGLITRATSAEAIALFRLVAAEAGRTPEVGRIFYERGPRRTWEQVVPVLAEAMDRGILRRDDPLIAARLLSSLCLAGTHQLLLLGLITEPDERVIEEDAGRALDTFLRSYVVGDLHGHSLSRAGKHTDSR
ncbi:TetR/AcrR family transcriptional regulator [Sphingomonas sp. ID0503]|uniref:TetR/AcrR family transcriptional regulator n=1 Tax=Sphingomonas sp. ID0503 TaxID=3399691 RepID=UPI003AFA745B